MARPHFRANSPLDGSANARASDAGCPGEMALGPVERQSASDGADAENVIRTELARQNK
jgi:hypothetical protein